MPKWWRRGSVWLLIASGSIIFEQARDWVRTVMPIWIYTGIVGFALCATLVSYWPELTRVFSRKKPAPAGPTIRARLTVREPYEVLQFWHQTVLERLLKVPPYPKVVRMLDTGQVVEWAHPNPDYGKREDS